MVGGLPSDMTTRAPQWDDLDAVYRLLAAQQEALHGEADVTRSDVEADWGRPSFDLAADAVLVEGDTGPVGVVEVSGTAINGLSLIHI